MSGKLRILAVAGLCGLVGACGIFDEDEERLPGERIAVLTTDNRLEADPTLEATAVELPAPVRNEAWPQPGGNTEHALGHVAGPSGLNRAWSADVGDGSTYDARLLAQPVIANGRVFTLDARDTASAFDEGSGRVIWRTDLEIDEEDDGYYGGGVAYSDGRVFVTTGFAMVFALDASNGQILWQRRVPAPMRSGPTVAAGRVFVITVDSQTIALDAANGNVIWTHRGIAETTSLIGGTSPAVFGQTVVTAYSSGEVFALQPENGRELWSDQLSSVQRVDPVADMADIRGLPIIDRGLVVVSGNARRTVAIDLRRGLRAWDLSAGGSETPWAAGDYIFTVTGDHQVLAVRRDDGRVRWATDLPAFEDPEDRDDPITWHGPVLAGGRLFVVGSNGQALIIAPDTGEVTSTVDLPGEPNGSPSVANGAIYMLMENGNLIKYR